MSPLIRLLPKVLLGAAGVATMAYVAWRQQSSRPLERRVPIAELEAQLRWWLPKLSFMPPVRLGTGRGSIEISSDGPELTVSWQHPAGAADFRRACERLGWLERRSPRPRAGIVEFRAPADAAALPPAIVLLLRELLGCRDGDEVLVSVPVS